MFCALPRQLHGLQGHMHGVYHSWVFKLLRPWYYPEGIFHTQLTKVSNHSCLRGGVTRDDDDGCLDDDVHGDACGFSVDVLCCMLGCRCCVGTGLCCKRLGTVEVINKTLK